MSRSLTLVVLAGGLSRRFGAHKQTTGLGPGGATLAEYGVFDAQRAGFERVLFVVNPEHAAEFEEQILQRIREGMDATCAPQRMDDLPAGCAFGAERQQPWGTAHAVWAARHDVDGPFAVINADDFYGRTAYEQLFSFLSTVDPDDAHYALVGYALRDTLAGPRPVSRAVCELGDGGRLIGLQERPCVVASGDHAIDLDDGQSIAGDARVSQNIWGFTPRIFQIIEQLLGTFLADARSAESELYLPDAVTAAIRSQGARVTLLEGGRDWCGVTYPEDRATVRRALQQLTAACVYPAELWSSAGA